MPPGSAGHMAWCGRAAAGGALPGPRHGRGAPHGGCLRRARPLSGFCRPRKEGFGEGAAPASEPAGLTRRGEPGRAGGEGGEERPPTGTAAPLRPPAPRPRWGVRPCSPLGAVSRHLAAPHTPCRGSPAAGESVGARRELEPFSTPFWCGGRGWQGFPQLKHAARLPHRIPGSARLEKTSAIVGSSL